MKTLIVILIALSSFAALADEVPSRCGQIVDGDGQEAQIRSAADEAEDAGANAG